MSLNTIWYAQTSNENKLSEEQYEIINTFIELFVIKYLKWQKPSQLTAKIVYKNVLQLCKLKWFNNVLYFQRSLHEMITWALEFHYKKWEKLLKIVKNTKKDVVKIFNKNEDIDTRVSPEINHKIDLLAFQAINDNIVLLNNEDGINYINNSIFPINTNWKEYLWNILIQKYTALVSSKKNNKLAIAC